MFLLLARITRHPRHHPIRAVIDSQNSMYLL